MPEKNPKVKLCLKNLAILPSYFDCIFVHLKQKERLRPELSPEIVVNFRYEPRANPNQNPNPNPNPNPTRKARPDLQL